MSKNSFFELLMEIVYWIAIFFSPVLLFGFIAVIVFANIGRFNWIPISLVGLGVALGIFFAEWVRRKYGCAKFMGRILSTPDIHPDE